MVTPPGGYDQYNPGQDFASSPTSATRRSVSSVRSDGWRQIPRPTRAAGGVPSPARVPSDVMSPFLWTSTKRCTRPVPCGGYDRTPSPTTCKAASSMRPSGPRRAATSRTGSFVSYSTKPGRGAALAPLYQHAMGELWKTVYKDQRGQACQPGGTPSPCRCSRCSARRNGWPIYFETVPLFLFPFSQYETPPAAPSTPPSGAPCWPPEPRVWAAADRAVAVSSIRPRPWKSSRACPTTRGGRRGTVGGGAPDGDLGVAPRASGARGGVPQHLGHRRSASRCTRHLGERGGTGGCRFAGTVLRVEVGARSAGPPGDVLVDGVHEDGARH